MNGNSTTCNTSNVQVMSRESRVTSETVKVGKLDLGSQSGARNHVVMKTMHLALLSARLPSQATSPIVLKAPTACLQQGYDCSRRAGLVT